MIILLWLTGIADLVLTAWGLSIDLFSEANPIMARAYDTCIIGTVIGGATVTGLACYVLHRARERVSWLNPCLWGLLVMRAVVLGLHAVWVTAIL